MTERQLIIPIRPGVAAEMTVPFPMTPADWDQMLAVLGAMKPGLVKDEDLPALTAGSQPDSPCCLAIPERS
jgi:hypothetical protein